MNHRSYTTVRIPSELVNEIDELISKRFCGYTSRAEFIKEAIRQRILELKNRRG